MVFDFYTSESNGDGVVRRSSKKSYRRDSDQKLRQILNQPIAISSLTEIDDIFYVEPPIRSLRRHAIAKGALILADNPFQRNYSKNKVRWDKKRKASRKLRLRNRGY